MRLNIHEDGGIKKFLRANQQATRWMPQVIKKNLTALKPYIVENMRDVLSVTNYSGKTSRSVRGHVQGAPVELFVEPTAKRGSYDAGLIRELGTRPIPNAPWKPIKKWAIARGLPPFPVWYKIRTRGIGKHPFLEPTIVRSRRDFDDAAGWIVKMAAQRLADAVSGGGAE